MLNVVLYGILGLVDIGTQYLSLCAILRLNQAVPTIYNNQFTLRFLPKTDNNNAIT